MSEVSTRQERFRRIAVLALVSMVMLALLGWGVWSVMTNKSKPPSRPPKITLLEPPPPPPPPPKEEKKPDPPKEQKEIKVEQPVPKPTPPQPSPELKMDGPAGNGPSAFAAGQITNEDLSKIGNGMFNPFNNYANMLKGELQRYFGKNKALSQRHYTVEVDVWVAGGGAIKRFELVGSTGDSDTDAAIRQAMSSLTSFKQTPPADMPQPIRLRIVTAG